MRSRRPPRRGSCQLQRVDVHRRQPQLQDTRRSPPHVERGSKQRQQHHAKAMLCRLQVVSCKQESPASHFYEPTLCGRLCVSKMHLDCRLRRLLLEPLFQQRVQKRRARNAFSAKIGALRASSICCRILLRSQQNHKLLVLAGWKHRDVVRSSTLKPSPQPSSQHGSPNRQGFALRAALKPARP